MYFAQNIRFLRQKYQFSQQQLSDRLNIPRTTVGDYERGHTEPNIDTLLRIAELYQVSVELLLRFNLSEEGMDISEKKGLKILSTTIDSRGRANIELVRSKAYAGYLESFDNPEFVQELPKLQLPGLKGQYYRAFEIQGDSMMPMDSGSVVICSYVEKLREVESGKTYVLVSRQSGLVYKRLYPEPKVKQMILRSDHPDYADTALAYEDISEIWKYHAHIGFSDPLEIFQDWNQYQYDEIHRKVRDIHKILVK